MMSRAERDDFEERLTALLRTERGNGNVNAGPLAVFLVQLLDRHDDLKARVEALEDRQESAP